MKLRSTRAHPDDYALRQEFGGGPQSRRVLVDGWRLSRHTIRCVFVLCCSAVQYAFSRCLVSSRALTHTWLRRISAPPLPPLAQVCRSRHRTRAPVARMTSRRPRRAIGSPETIAEVDDTSVPSATAAQPAQSGDDAEEPHVAANIAKRRAARAAQRRAEEAKLEAEVESLRARSATPAEPASADSDVEPSASAPPLARWSTSPRSSMGMTDAPQKQLKRADSASKLLESAVSQSFRKSKKRSTETIDCFVQRWTKEKVQQAYERIFELLYPGFQPTEADEDTLHTALYDLRDEWQKHIADRSVPLLAHEIAGTAAAGVQYVLDEPTESNRPLVITVAQLQQVLNFTFEREDTGESAKSTEDEELSIPAELHANEHRIRLQRILRPFLDRYFNLHQATLPQTPLRNTLREVTSLLLVCCYGHETHLLAACLNAFKLMPSNTLSTGTLQRLATEVCSIAFEFTSHLEDDTKLCVVEFFGGVLRNHVAAMTPGGQITILELTMTLSQDSHIKELLSKHLLPYTFKQLPPAAVSWCLCGRGGPQGDEGSQGGTGSAPSSAAPSAPPSAPPSTGPTLRHLRADSLTSSEPPRHLRNSSSTSSLGAGSGSMSASAAANIVPVLCILCQQAEADEATSTSKEFAKATFQRMIDSVVQVSSRVACV
jgi:hypothetical protein